MAEASSRFERLVAENNALIWRPDLGNGRLIASARTAIYTQLVGEWAEAQQRALGYDKPFAVVALGGTGRAEMAPCSDNDFAFLFEDAPNGVISTDLDGALFNV
jgi:UTP:GlnB (protein PII) uridylyltransferase